MSGWSGSFAWRPEELLRIHEGLEEDDAFVWSLRMRYLHIIVGSGITSMNGAHHPFLFQIFFRGSFSWDACVGGGLD